jgi:hypothetical protein
VYGNADRNPGVIADLDSGDRDAVSSRGFRFNWAMAAPTLANLDAPRRVQLIE